MEQWLEQLPCNKKAAGSTTGLSVGCLHVLPVFFSGYSSFLPQTKNMHVRLVGVSERVDGHMSPCVSVMDCTCPGVPHLQRKWMDVLFFFNFNCSVLGFSEMFLSFNVFIIHAF